MWPENTLAFGVIAQERAGLDRVTKVIAENTANALLGRWPDVRVRVVKGPAVGAIVRRAKAVRADVIVMGWRGHGTFRRLMAGSVSRGVVRRAPCSVLVVRRAISRLQNMVIGFDGSEQAKRAIALVARLPVPANGRATLVTAVDTLRMPPHALLPSDLRGNVATEARARTYRSVTSQGP